MYDKIHYKFKKKKKHLLKHPSNWLYWGFSHSFFSFWFPDMLEYILSRQLCSEYRFEWVFAVEPRRLSRFSAFPFREHVRFKRWCGSLLMNIHLSADVHYWNWSSEIGFSLFDSHPWFLLAVMFTLWETVRTWFCPLKHALRSLYALIYFHSLVKCKFVRWNLSCIPSFDAGSKSSKPGFWVLKPWVSWEDTPERYQIISYSTDYCWGI